MRRALLRQANWRATCRRLNQADIARYLSHALREAVTKAIKTIRAATARIDTEKAQ